MFDVVQSSWTSTTYLPTWQMDMDWMQPGNNSNIHPTRRRFYIPLRKSDRKKEKNGKKKEVRKRKAPIHNRFIDMGWYIIHGSVGENILIQTPSFSSKRRKGLSGERDDVREKRVRGEQCNCSDNKRRTRRRRRRTRNWRRKRRKESLIERYLNRI